MVACFSERKGDGRRNRPPPKKIASLRLCVSMYHIAQCAIIRKIYNKQTMKNLKFLMLAFLSAVAFSSCELDELCEKGEGPTVSKELSLPPFHSLVLDVSAEVFITQGETQNVSVEVQENIIDKLE